MATSTKFSAGDTDYPTKLNEMDDDLNLGTGALTVLKDAAAGSATSAAADVLTTGNNVTLAVAAKDAAETALNTMDLTYLGAKNADPALDNEGETLAAGDRYFNTVSNKLKLYDGTAWATIQDGIGSLSEDTTPQLGGNLDLSGSEVLINMSDNILQRPLLKDYSEKKVAMAAHDVNLELGNVFTYTLLGGQTLTFTNPSVSGTASSFTLIITNGGNALVTWPTTVDWPAATAPTLTADGIDILVFTTIDGGTNWYGVASGIGMA